MKRKVYIPPLKIQGIKTKLVPTIAKCVDCDKNAVWIEPFMGSGVVGENLAGKNAIFADTNPYTIDLYQKINEGKITPAIARDFLEKEGAELKEKDDVKYYQVRDRFNEEHNPLDFLFLNRSCFNGMIRFNQKSNKFNVPYGHKPNRFAPAYITKICNQIDVLQQKMKANNWKYVCQPFQKTIAEAPENSFFYVDPPYIGRHVDYFDSWNEESEIALHDALINSGHHFILSTWDYNDFRKNEYINKVWKGCYKVDIPHFYNVGAKESNRHPIMEALLMNYEPSDYSETENEELKIEQVKFDL